MALASDEVGKNACFYFDSVELNDKRVLQKKSFDDTVLLR